MSTQLVNTSHGVLHTPSSTPDWVGPSIQKLKEAGIKYVRIQWVDWTNNVRLRIAPITYYEKLMQSPRPGISLAKATFGAAYLVLAEGFSATGEYLYVPDPTTMRICPYAPGHASVLGWFEEKTPYKGVGKELTVKTDLCPRTKLRNLVQEAKDAGIEFLVGFESEFVLLKSTDPVVTANVHHWTHVKGLLTGMTETRILEEIADSLIESGIQVELYHPEAAPGQYEVVTGPLQPLQAADALVHTRETIANISSKYGFHATFAPRITMTSTGNGLHSHISVHSASHKKPNDTLSELESSFLAGILDDLPALPALTLPIPASFKRVGDGIWSGGTYVAWGTDNRECPIRLCNATSPGSRRFEMRCMDPTSNPHVALTGILGLGLAGIKLKRQLTVKNFDKPMGPAQLSEEERLTFGIKQRMPLNWEESRRNLSHNEALRRILGDEFVTKYLAVNKTLGETLSVDDADEQKALTRLVEFY